MSLFEQCVSMVSVRTKEEQDFIDYFEIMVDYGESANLTESDIQKYEFLINYTK